MAWKLNDVTRFIRSAMGGDVIVGADLSIFKEDTNNGDKWHCNINKLHDLLQHLDSSFVDLSIQGQLCIRNRQSDKSLKTKEC